jgi:hypothetical protein
MVGPGMERVERNDPDNQAVNRPIYESIKHAVSKPGKKRFGHGITHGPEFTSRLRQSGV